MSEKEKQRKVLFLVNDRKCFTLSPFTFIYFFNCPKKMVKKCLKNCEMDNF